MEFKGPYLQAMREQAPKMFNRLRRTGALETHLEQKGAEAQRMFDDMTANAPKLPNGLPEQPYRREAEEIVFATLIEFPPDDDEQCSETKQPNQIRSKALNSNTCMTSYDLFQLQKKFTNSALSSLISRCIDRYLKAADLLQLRGQVPEQLRRAEFGGETTIHSLLPVWDRICERYRNDLHSPQIDIFENHEEVTVARWSQFLYHELFPTMERENEVVRNVLRAVQLLPCEAPGKAADALVFYVSEMDIRHSALKPDRRNRDDD